MTRLFHTGFEIDPGPTQISSAPNGPEGQWAGTDVRGVRNTVEHRSGASCIALAADTASTSYIQVVTINSASVSFFCRAYMKFSALPFSSFQVLATSAASRVSVRLTPAGKAQLWNNVTAAQIGSDSAATVAPGVYNRYELSYTLNASSQLSACAFRLDGTEVASTTGLALGTAGNGFLIGLVSGPGTPPRVTCYLDDVAVNNSFSVANNSWPGAGSVVLMRPLADTQRGSWTAGAGGITNLFQAVRNTPPLGATTPTNTTQIRSADPSGDNATDEYRGSCGSYTAAGVGASDTVDGVAVWVCSAEEANPGTKTLSAGAQTNPAAAYGGFSAGNNTGAMLAYPSRWAWGAAAITNVPALTLTDALVLACRKTDVGTRYADICFLGAYVSYVAAAPVSNTYTKAGLGREGV